jgi:LemA protein
MAITIIGLIIFILIVLIFTSYNTLTKLKLKVKQSKSTIDVYLQQRFDLIPNLVNTVKGYMNYEKETFENITKLRTQYNETKSIKVSEELNNQINKIIAIAENYPELKSSEQFLNLQKNLSKIESQLQAARRLYNNDVTKYNTKISVIPYNIIAMIFGFNEEDLFQIEEGAKENISITI